MSANLVGLTVLVTRPAAQAEALCTLLSDAGASVQRLPLLSIEPVPQAAELIRVLSDHAVDDAWIFTSRNAVERALALHQGRWPTRLYAVGAATAQALVHRGLPCLTPSTEYSSEGLLALADLQQVDGQRLLILTGSDGRDALAPALRARGAEVAVVELYRRLPVPHPPQHVAAVLQHCQAGIVTSGDALRQLLRLTPADLHSRLQQFCLVLPSLRVVELARQHGFQTLLVPEQITDAAFVRCLEQWWTTQGKP